MFYTSIRIYQSTCCCFALLMLAVAVTAQERKIRPLKSKFQIALFPGISTNGIRSASFTNKFSINLFGGIALANQYFEFSPITNVELQSTTGIQIAGLANIIGPNTFVNLTTAEERALMQAGYKVNQQGVQVSGLLNYVLNDGGGIQLTGALNVVGDDFTGVQIAGIGNGSGGYVIGLQIAGLYNIARQSMSGVQVSVLSNYTDGELSGTQIALINKAKIMSGRKSTPPTSAYGLQIGLINMSKTMAGTQIGLINFGGTMRGKQFGLINFFSTEAPQQRVRAGTPVGLLNFGTSGSYFRYQYNEMFNVNFEWTSGNCLNCTRILGSNMPFEDRNQIFNQNALILGFDTRQHVWGFGYGFVKVLYSKLTVMPSPNNRKRVITYGIRFLHLNRNSSFDKSKNIVTRLGIDYGKRWKGHYFFGGLSINYFLHEAGDDVEIFGVQSKIFKLGQNATFASAAWPGYSFGFQF